MECVAVVADGREEDEAAGDAAAAASTLAEHSFLIHLLISGPLRSYRSLAPLQPAEWNVVTVCRAASTRSLPSNSLNASRMMRLLMPRKRWSGVGTIRENGQQSGLIGVNGVTVAGSAIASAAEEAT